MKTLTVRLYKWEVGQDPNVLARLLCLSDSHMYSLINSYISALKLTQQSQNIRNVHFKQKYYFTLTGNYYISLQRSLTPSPTALQWQCKSVDLWHACVVFIYYLKELYIELFEGSSGLWFCVFPCLCGILLSHRFLMVCSWGHFSKCILECTCILVDLYLWNVISHNLITGPTQRMNQVKCA